MWEVLICGGSVIDGTGAPWFRGDVAVKDGRIAAVGRIADTEAETVIDARGQVVAPGFIDIHSHSDAPLLVSGNAESKTRQGVTTELIGNCGTSLGPVPVERREALSGQLLRGLASEIEFDWSSLGDYLSRLEEQGVAVNVAPQVGQGTIRRVVMDYDNRPPTPTELNKMKELVRQAMADGAFGMSTGLTYTPSGYADLDEVVELAEVVAEFGGFYTSHIRNEADLVLEAASEAIAVGERAGLPAHIVHLKATGSHNWGKSLSVLDLVGAARERGVDVTVDQYPYHALSTGLGALLPPWAAEGGWNAFRRRLENRNDRNKMRREMEQGTNTWASYYKGVGWDNVLVARCDVPGTEGNTIADLARRAEKEAFDYAFDLLRDTSGSVSVVVFAMSQEDVARVMRSRLVMFGSDGSSLADHGPLAAGVPHPRNFGTFPRVLGHFVREKGVLTLEEAVRKMTALPAARIGLRDRGLLRPGFAADITVFDPDRVIDRATFTRPQQYPDGINHVIVNGTVVINDAEHTGARPGRVLRRQ